MPFQSSHLVRKAFLAGLDLGDKMRFFNPLLFLGLLVVFTEATDGK